LRERLERPLLALSPTTTLSQMMLGAPPRPRLGRPSFGSLEGKAVRDRKEAVRSLERHFARVVHEHCPAVEEERMASSDRPVLVPVLR
jgi:hypothetical protein